ncbi:hypothetical protein RLIN73S_04764 [Rhodanobacter lindaniclasticus]
MFARAALALKYDEDKPAPITESQILMPRRHDDDRRDLWSVFNRAQEKCSERRPVRPRREWPPSDHPARAGH